MTDDRRAADSPSSRLPPAESHGASHTLGRDDHARQLGDPADEFTELAAKLEAEARKLKFVALLIGLVGCAVLGFAAWFGVWSTSKGLAALDASDYHPTVLIFELVRTTAAAALLGAFLWGLLNLGRAALDQATRYEKRLVAGRFLVYVFHTFRDQMENESLSLKDVMEVFKAWSDNVESAFTHVKFGSRNNQGVSVLAKNGFFSMGLGGAVAPSLPTSNSDEK